MNFNAVLEMVNKLQATNSNKDKLAILNSYVGHENEKLIKNVLSYCYDTFKKYGISEAVYDEIPFVSNTIFKSPFEMFDKLAESNINDLLRLSTKAYIENVVEEEYRELIKGILFKDLKIGVNAKSINKVWKGLVPEFNVQLAESLAKQKDDYLHGKEFTLTTKLDGYRCVYLPKEKKFFSRQGQEFEGIDHLIEECDKISQGIYVLDGELLYRNFDNLPSDDLYRLTSSITRKKGKTKEKTNLEFHLFDIIPLGDFQKGASVDVYQDRMALLERLHSQATELDFLKRVTPLYTGSDTSVIPTLLDKVAEQGEEGLMLNLLDGLYECKRSKNILKIKQFLEADVLVVGVYEGKKGKKYEGTLGGLTVKFLYNGQEMTADVGSGFSEEERELFFNRPETIIGKVITINYFELSNNKKGEYDLRFATYQHRIREDKTEEDITDVATA